MFKVNAADFPSSKSSFSYSFFSININVRINVFSAGSHGRGWERQAVTVTPGAPVPTGGLTPLSAAPGTVAHLPGWEVCDEMYKGDPSVLRQDEAPELRYTSRHIDFFSASASRAFGGKNIHPVFNGKKKKHGKLQVITSRRRRRRKAGCKNYICILTPRVLFGTTLAKYEIYSMN